MTKRNEDVPKMSSLDEIDLRSSKVPRLPQITDKDSSYSEGYNSARSLKFGRERNFFAKGHADKGVLFKSALSTSLPDLPSLTKPQGTPRRYEKLSYKKRIHEGELPPPPGTSIHAVAPLSPTGLPRLPAIKTTTVRKKARRRHTDADVFKIYNSTRHTVEYYEHEGHVYVSDSTRPWKEDCQCRNCSERKHLWLDEHRKGAERTQRKSFHRGVPNASPVKELREDVSP